MSPLGAPLRVCQAVSPESHFCRCPGSGCLQHPPPAHGGWALQLEPGAPFKVPVVPRFALGDLLTSEGVGQGGGGPSPLARGTSVEKQALRKPFPELQQRLPRGLDTPKGATFGLARG